MRFNYLYEDSIMKIKALIIISSIAFLTGCGVVGSKAIFSLLSGDGSNEEVQSALNTINGAAFKGLIDGGIVNVYEMTSNNIKGNLVGSAITDSNGAYTITLSDTYDSTKNVIIELTTDETTSITCDAINGCGPNVARGTSYAPSSNFKLSSISTPISGDNSASITPYTDMAKANFDANPNEGVSAAISRVNQIAGVNILEVKPIDITGSTISSTASKEQQQYAVMLAAYASTIFGDGTVSVVDSEAKIKSASEEFADGIFGNGGADDLSAADLMTAVKAEVSNAGGTLNADMLSSVNAFVSVREVVIVDGVLATETPVDVDLDTVSQAKVFITDTRTWVDSFDTLETSANVFKEQADSISSVLNDKTDVVFDNLIWVAEAAGEKLKYARDNNSDVPTAVVVKNGSGDTIGAATLTGDSTVSEGASYVAEATISGVEVSITASLNRDYINDSSINSGTIVLNLSASAKNNYAEITFENSKLTLVTNVDIIEGVNTDLESASFVGGVFRAEILNSGESTGKMMEGNINVEFVKATDSNNAAISEGGLNLKKFELTKLKITDEQDSYANLTLRVNVDNAADHDIFNVNTESYTESSFIKGELNITGELDLFTKPKALASLTVSSSAFERGIAKILVSYDSKSLEFAISNLGETVDDRKLEVSNQDGYKLVFEWTDMTTLEVGDVLKQNTGSGKLYAPDGTEVGKIDKTTNNITIIRYNDGTIESF